MYMLATTIKLSMLFKFWGCGYLYTWKNALLDIGLAVTEINTKKVWKQENKNIKNVKRRRDGVPQSMQTR